MSHETREELLGYPHQLLCKQQDEILHFTDGPDETYGQSGIEASALISLKAKFCLSCFVLHFFYIQQ